ncbi:MAG: alpha/beta fold hydrolase [Candidatus Micrarchaeia archaeon]
MDIRFKNTAGEFIAGILSEPSRPNGKAIVLLHCFTCTKHHRIMRGISESLSGKGYSVLRFDFSGNGESEGRIEEATYTKMIGEVRSAVDLLGREGFKKVAVAGHSMGAMLSALSAHEDRRLKAVAFIAGSSQAARVREVFPKEALDRAESEGESEAFVYGRTIRLRKEFLLDVERYNIGHAVATLKRPMLIIHGAADEIIPPYHARQIYQWASEPKTLEMLDGVDHLFRKEEHLAMVKESVSGWFAANF